MHLYAARLESVRLACNSQRRASPIFLLFGKYVGWSYLSVCLLLAKITILASMLVGHVCYLPKLAFWQVCWLVVFVCLSVCTEISQNLKNDSVNHHLTWSQASTSPFWKFRNILDRFILTAWRQNVPSISMFKWNCHIFRDTGRNFLPIITKLGQHM